MKTLTESDIEYIVDPEAFINELRVTECNRTLDELLSVYEFWSSGIRKVITDAITEKIHFSFSYRDNGRYMLLKLYFDKPSDIQLNMSEGMSNNAIRTHNEQYNVVQINMEIIPYPSNKYMEKRRWLIKYSDGREPHFSNRYLRGIKIMKQRE